MKHYYISSTKFFDSLSGLSSSRSTQISLNMKVYVVIEANERLPDANSGIPSWSWASVNSAIDTGFDEDVFMGQLAYVVDANVTLAGINPFGHVHSGRLVLEGSLAVLRLAP